MRNHLIRLSLSLALISSTGCVIDPSDHPYQALSKEDAPLDMSGQGEDLPVGEPDLPTSEDMPMPDPPDMTTGRPDMTMGPKDMETGPPDMGPRDMTMGPPDMGVEVDMGVERCTFGEPGCMCQGGVPCLIDEDKDPDCKRNACDIQCPGDGHTCKPKNVGDDGVIVCEGANATCEPDCVGDCRVACEITLGTCKVDCKEGAVCELSCKAGNGTCEFGRCDGGSGITACADGRIMCNGPC